MRTERFTFLCTVDERAALERLAALWQRSKSDTIRLLIASALERLFATDQGPGGEQATKATPLKAEPERYAQHGGLS
jgi:hypothetical protein